MKPEPMHIDLAQIPPERCGDDCPGEAFEPVYKIKIVNGLMVGSPSDVRFTEMHLRCTICKREKYVTNEHPFMAVKTTEIKL